MKEFSGVGT